MYDLFVTLLLSQIVYFQFINLHFHASFQTCKLLFLFKVFIIDMTCNTNNFLNILRGIHFLWFLWVLSLICRRKLKMILRLVIFYILTLNFLATCLFIIRLVRIKIVFVHICLNIVDNKHEIFHFLLVLAIYLVIHHKRWRLPACSCWYLLLLTISIAMTFCSLHIPIPKYYQISI